MEPENKRQRILTAARDLFVEKGFSQTSVQDITEAADVAKGTLYLYFRSKDDLIDRVFDDCHDRDVAACDQGLEEEESTIAKLCRRMENGIRWAMGYPKDAALERLYLNYPKRRCVGPHYTQQRHFANVDRLIRQGIADGELKNIPPLLLGEVFFGIGGAYYHYVQSDPHLIHDEATWNLCKQTVVDCLSK